MPRCIVLPSPRRPRGAAAAVAARLWCPALVWRTVLCGTLLLRLRGAWQIQQRLPGSRKRLVDQTENALLAKHEGFAMLALAAVTKKDGGGDHPPLMHNGELHPTHGQGVAAGGGNGGRAFDQRAHV